MGHDGRERARLDHDHRAQRPQLHTRTPRPPSTRRSGVVRHSSSGSRRRGVDRRPHPRRSSGSDRCGPPPGHWTTAVCVGCRARSWRPRCDRPTCCRGTAGRRLASRASRRAVRGPRPQRVGADVGRRRLNSRIVGLLARGRVRARRGRDLLDVAEPGPIPHLDPLTECRRVTRGRPERDQLGECPSSTANQPSCSFTTGPSTTLVRRRSAAPRHVRHPASTSRAAT